MSRRPASFATASPTPPVPRSAGPDGQPAAAGSSALRLILVGDRPVRVRHRPAVQGARRARDGARRSGRDDRVRGRPALPRPQAAPGLHRRGHDRPQDAARRLSSGSSDQVLRSPKCVADRDQQSPGVLRVIDRNGEKHPRWRPMGKSVEHFWRYAQVAEGANRRLIDALANAPLKGAATQELDELCRSRNQNGARVARFNPVDAQTVLLFIAVLSGEFAITGFRNRDLQAKLFDTVPRDDREARRRTHQTSRLIAKLRGHRLITKIGKSRLYRVTARGIKAMWPAIRFRKNDFPIDFQRLASAGC